MVGFENVIVPEKVEKQFKVAVVVVEAAEPSDVTRAADARPVRGHDLAELCHVRDEEPQEVVEIAEEVRSQ